MITSILILAANMQAAGEVVEAVQPEKPQTWSVEYPYAMAPYVDDYRRCLNMVTRVIGDGTTFESQHRADIPRCSEAAAEAQAASEAVLAKMGRGEELNPDYVPAVFDTIRYIHIERGRDLDIHIRTRLASNPMYRDDVQMVPSPEATSETAPEPTTGPMTGAAAEPTTEPTTEGDAAAQ